MDVFALDDDVAEGDAVILAHGFVVVAGDQHHMLAVAGSAQDLLHHGVLRWGPVDADRFMAQKSMMSPTRNRFSLS
jgi:hypothetical protein